MIIIRNKKKEIINSNFKFMKVFRSFGSEGSAITRALSNLAKTAKSNVSSKNLSSLKVKSESQVIDAINKKAHFAENLKAQQDNLARGKAFFVRAKLKEGIDTEFPRDKENLENHVLVIIPGHGACVATSDKNPSQPSSTYNDVLVPVETVKISDRNFIGENRPQYVTTHIYSEKVNEYLTCRTYPPAQKLLENDPVAKASFDSFVEGVKNENLPGYKKINVEKGKDNILKFNLDDKND